MHAVCIEEISVQYLKCCNPAAQRYLGALFSAWFSLKNESLGLTSRLSINQDLRFSAGPAAVS
jgi:hypothetical protein